MRTIEQRAAEFERAFASRERAGWRYYTAGHGKRCCSCQKVAAIRDTPWEQTLDAARAALHADGQQSPDGDFWIAQVEAVYHRAGRDGLANSYAMLLDLAQRSDELRPRWDGPTLVVAAADDPLITPTHQQRLLDLHPGCELHVFPDGGHSLLFTRPGDYLSEVTRHLLSQR